MSPFFTWARFLTASPATKVYSCPSSALSVTSRVFWLIFVTFAVTCTEASTASPLGGAAGAWASAKDVTHKATATQPTTIENPDFLIVHLLRM